MPYIDDLTPNVVDYEFVGVKSLAVGWLDPQKPFRQGEVSQEFKARLCNFCSPDYLVWLTRGVHTCEICDVSPTGWIIKEGILQTDAGLEAYGFGNGEIRVFGKYAVFAAPRLIYHYVVEHKYKPPQEFIEAVLTGPQPGSKDYETLWKKWGNVG